MATTKLNTVIQVRRDTTANWLINKDFIPAAGEPCLDLDTGVVKYGNGVDTYENLPVVGGTSASHYEGIKVEGENDSDVISRVLTAAGVEAKKDDIFIVKTLISAENYSHTSYVYNGTNWSAMDGNYNAENVYFDEDLTTTSAVGNITLTNGQATIPTTGKNLKQVFETIYVKEKNPSTTQPSVGLTFSEAKAYEVGTSVTPNYTAKLNAGSYTYGPATGITADSWTITDTDGNTATEESGSFAAITVDDDTEYKITAKATYSDGAIPVTNTGNAYEAGQIKAGEKSATSSAITGYRNTFYGTVEDKEAVVDSAAIRALATKSDKALVNGNEFTVEVPVGAMSVIIAYPATLQDCTSIKDVNGMYAEIVGSFTKSTVQVEGANGATAIDYKVYKLDFAEANDKANTFNVII